MIVTSLQVTTEQLERRTGWQLTGRGACRGEVCIPVRPETHRDGIVDVALLADQLGMPLIHDDKHGLWSLGPQSGGTALPSAVAPPLVLPGLDGSAFDLGSLRGEKVLLLAWASW